MSKSVNILYGKGAIPLHADPSLTGWTVIRPTQELALADPHTSFLDACRQPSGSSRLRDLIQPSDRVVIVTSDGTRPVPNRQLIPWLLEELPTHKVEILLGNGSHRANTSHEIAAMFGPDLEARLKIHNHNAFEPRENRLVGRTGTGANVYLDRRYVEADKRVVVGFIEPHFFAGFSGGAKAVVPGVAGIDTIMHIHRWELVADHMSSWGIMEANPIQQEISEMAALCPPDFMVNVALNTGKEITAIFAGDYREAHRLGCAYVKQAAMVAVPHPYPIVVTSNSGRPLDQNLYQAVKGISAASRIVAEGGDIFIASECAEGVPSDSVFEKLMRAGSSPEDILEHISHLKEPIVEQWEAQVLAAILRKAKVHVLSKIDAAKIEACKMTPIDDLQSAVNEAIRRVGRDCEIAVLPEGPLTIPYISA